MRSLVLMVIGASGAFACSCAHGDVDDSCAKARGAIVFVVRVTVESGQGVGSGPAHAIVEEAISDAPNTNTEVLLETAAGSSCYRRVVGRERYVVIASTPGKSGAFYVGGCSPTFPVRGNEHVLDALRNQAKRGPSRIVGTVRESRTDYVHRDAVAGATVSVETNLLRAEVKTDAEGHYEFRALPPGRYLPNPAKPKYVANSNYNSRWSGRMIIDPATNKIAQDPIPGIILSESACAVWDLSMWANGRISGTVSDPNQQSLEGVTVQAFAFNERGRRESSPFRIAKTDGSGNYTLDRLPSGDYVVGVNAGAYEDADPHPPAIYGTAGQASRIHVTDSEETRGIDLIVKPKRTPATLRVVSIGEDGRPMVDVNVSLENAEGVQRWSGRGTNPFTWRDARVYVGEEYLVRVSKTVSRDALNMTGWVSFEGTARIRIEKPYSLITVFLSSVP